MRFGIAVFATDQVTPVTEIARLVESRGLESLWVTEHSHIPASRLTPYPRGGPLPERYWHALDPFIALTAAAAVTSQLLLGTGICLAAQRDPLHLAKETASLDHLSGGRLLLGVSAGWNREEFENHGCRFADRWAVLREKVEAVKAIWTETEAEYHGRFVDFDPIWSWPKPVQRPHPPIYLAGNVEPTLRRVVAYADGWMPNSGHFLARIPELRRLAEAAGRPHLPVSAYGFLATPEEIAEYRAAGADRVIYYVPFDDPAAAVDKLDQVAELARQEASAKPARQADNRPSAR